MFTYLAELDLRTFRALTQFGRKHDLEASALKFSASGNGPLYLCLALLMLLEQDGQRFFVLLLLAYAVELPLYLLLKNAIRRKRPCHQVLVGFRASFEPSDKFSLPSGHTAGAFVFASAVWQIYPPLAVPAFIWAGLVGVSRVFLGVHYPLDILAGALLGCSATLIAVVWI
ncbi:phosphatase PAP2 family protein [Shewanella algae]|uniref:phosphatase PAP2 family protein n=1 Tax=Shewanella algae TaxID=38313 RepID=UPI000B8B2F72|nr:phosphatase PAP2 family protein [Shewanella algae]OXR99244.1 hypothetical protein AMR44_19305 [Shewanella algae]